MSDGVRIIVRITDGPLPIGTVGQLPGSDVEMGMNPGAVGATVVFTGIVRREEAGRRIRALKYDVYEPMASRMLHALAAEMVRKHGLLGIDVEHSRGEVPVDEGGGCSFRLTVHAAHRKEALAAIDEFTDRMKKDVPIWKTPVWE